MKRTTRTAAMATAAMLAAGVTLAPAPAYRIQAGAAMAACAEEDSPGPCVWDAQARGNGRGRSFYVDAAQRVHYIPNPFKVHSRVLGDCEDDNLPVCFTRDDGRWRVVKDYDPYRYRNVNLCNRQRTNLPCLTRGKTVNTPAGTYNGVDREAGSVQVRTVYYRGRL